VLQDSVLFSTSIAENIAYGSPGIHSEAIVAAAQAANAHDFIVRLPHGYDTQVGERGVQLSGGQRQRIALARAFLQDSPVLILDEPTSAVDAESESAILSAIRRLMRGRTVLVITHRSSMLEGCASVLAIENGRVVDDITRPQFSTRPPVAPSAVGKPPSNVMSHPAARAWCQLYPRAEPLQITPLRVRKRKNKIYRIDVAGHSAVIAKRCRKEGALIERAVYERVLPLAAVPLLGYHGFLEEPDGEHCWIFIDEATGDSYSRLLAEHRAEAGRWLGLLHSSAAGIAINGHLPDGGPRRYMDILQETCDFVQQHLDNPVLTPDDIMLLERNQAHLRDIAAHWDRLEAVCDGAPQTLVHGDFNAKNLRLRSENGHTTVVVFDWEDAGWGVPAADLAQAVLFSRLSASPDIPTYWSTVREHWPNASADSLQRLAHCGSAFRALAGLSWELPNLASDWAHACATDLQVYVSELDDALERLGWSKR
jgi:energy-coupling factor transporter ATP-binding protein EcfA2